MLNSNSNKIREVKGYNLLQAGGKKGRPRLLHNGINGQKGGTNTKGTPAKPPIMKEKDLFNNAIAELKKKRR